ncbi:MAG: HAD family hydrolase [Candidatus Delongbacteria bacterium]|nr:HAD family hydrolase [Candidatus Delongbacteria bacterium]MBN2836366.1 HAD family hydrolase [Candidatus Delongbacteria bacterium]
MKYIVGIDLHGTLLDDDEKVRSDYYDKLKNLFREKPSNFKLYVCTGNDLPFVQRKLGDLLELFDGSVLETGAVISYDNLTETVITESVDVEKIKKLQKRLESEEFPEIYKYARRLSSISMFTNFGESVEKFFKTTCSYLEDDKDDYYRITHSSVAVDIVPAFANKYFGLKYIANDDDIIVGIADSLNDLEMLEKSDMSFVPNNYSKKLDGITVRSFRSLSDYNNNFIGVSEGKTSEGVYQIVSYLFKNYGV